MRVECGGDRVLFARSQGQPRFHAIYDHEQRILSLYFQLSATFDLTGARATPPRASTLAFRWRSTPTRSRYQGATVGNGVYTEVGIDPKPISDLVQSLIDTPISDVAAPYPEVFAHRPPRQARVGGVLLRIPPRPRT